MLRKIIFNDEDETWLDGFDINSFGAKQKKEIQPA